jgi:hypothetical protein
MDMTYCGRGRSTATVLSVRKQRNPSTVTGQQFKCAAFEPVVWATAQPWGDNMAFGIVFENFFFLLFFVISSEIVL